MQDISRLLIYRFFLLFRIGLISLLLLQVRPVVAQVKTAPPSANQTKSTPNNIKSQAPLNDILNGTQETRIEPGDWKFKALLGLGDRYDCASELSEDKPVSRSEFAQGLNSCLDTVSKLIAQAPSTNDPVPNNSVPSEPTPNNPVTREDLETIKKLQSEFATELQAINGKIEALEAKITKLQQSQFSTTTKLSMEAMFVGHGLISGNNVLTGQQAPRTAVLQDRVRIFLSSSFTGKDALRIILNAGNTLTLGFSRPAVPNANPALVNTFINNLGTYEGLISDFTTPAFQENGVYLTTATYRTPIGPNTDWHVFAQSEGVIGLGLTRSTNPYFESGGADNSVTRFGRRNPIYGYGDSGPGTAFLHKITPELEIGAAYTAVTGQDPSPSRGLFAGRYTTGAQLTYTTLDKKFSTALTYINGYSPPGTLFGTATGSNLANSTTGYGATVDAVGIGTFYQFSPGFGLNAWYGYSKHNYLKGQFSPLGGGADVSNWAVGAAFPDAFGKGNLLGLLVGQEPRVNRLDSTVDLGKGLGVGDRDNSYHLEAFYQVKINDNIKITPALILITAPNSDSRNPSNVIGYFRTTFKF